MTAAQVFRLVAIPTPPVDLTVVIPAFNEEQRLGPTIDQLARFLTDRGGRFEIIVVDDGSTDGTVTLCECLAGRWPVVRVIPTAPNRGKGHAVRVGMRAARGAVVLMTDADGSTPASEIPRVLLPLLEGRAAVAIGSRYLPGAAPAAQPLWRRLWSRLVNLFIQSPACATPSAASRPSPPPLPATCSRAPPSTAGPSTSRSSPWPAASATPSSRSP
jgi:dolichyl-phosphate beta-glucosyltransferase